MEHNKDQVIKDNWFTKFPLGNDVPGERHFRDAVEEATALAPGWKAEDVNYMFNNWCYRGTAEPAMYAHAAFGCSYTFGAGVQVPWPALLNVVNCGQPGSSNDKIARLAISYCEQFNPSTIYVMWTFGQRREWVDKNGNVQAFKNVTPAEATNMLNSNIVSWGNSHVCLMNDLADDYNYTKNRLLVQSYCAANDIYLIETNVLEIDKDMYSSARDGTHPGMDWHLNVTASLIT